MSEVVNATSKSQLSARNSEPTHNGGAPKTDIGGEHDGVVGAAAGKIDAASGVSTDTTIPKSVAAEPSHLKGDSTPVVEDSDIDVDFGDEKNEEVDDLDKAIGEAVDDKEIDVEVQKEEADDDKKDDVVKEDFPFQKKDDDKDGDDKKDKKVDESAHADDCDCEVCKKVDEAADDDKIEESVKVKITMPKATLFESSGFDAKQQKQVATLFESAIKDTTRQVSKQLNEAYRARTNRAVAAVEKKLTERLDTYLSVVVESWIEENKVALTKNVRTELAEGFLNGLAKLFKESHVDVPEGKINVVETLTGEVEVLKKKLNEQNASNLKLRRLAESANKARIVAQFARNMSEAQAAKLAKLAEDTQYVDAKDFRTKLSMLKESYFGQKADEKQITRLPEETVVVQEEKKSNAQKNEIDLVVDAISNQAQRSSW